MFRQLTRFEEKILKSLKLSESDFYRFREAKLNEPNSLRPTALKTGDTFIHVYTQGGGQNRVCYCDYLGELDEGGRPVIRNVDLNRKKHEADCSQVLDYRLRQHSLYVSDVDDIFDKDFANWYFRLP
jgi:hypothetical protein